MVLANSGKMGRSWFECGIVSIEESGKEKVWVPVAVEWNFDDGLT
jgi:hypothetical protein